MDQRDIEIKYAPKQAIIVYRGTEDLHERNAYFEIHDIDGQGKLLAGKPLRKETLQKIVKFITAKKISFMGTSGILPQNILSISQDENGPTLVWIKPNCKIKLHFAKKLEIPSGEYLIPSLIFKSENNDLYVYAVKESDRLDLKTKLYEAPFHNIYDSGDVCLGNTKSGLSKHRRYFHEEIAYWEDMFFNSRFSHVLSGRKIINGNLNTVYQSLSSTKKPFPLELLRPHAQYKTLNELLK